jgi:hypothetical protein
MALPADCFRVFQAGHTSSPSLKTAAVFLREQARQPFRPGPCPCGAVRFQFLHPSPILTRVHSTGRTRLAQTAIASCFRIQLRRIQSLLAAPGAACRLIHRCSCDDCLQSRRRCPALAATARSVGQGLRPPALQRRRAHTNLARDNLDRRTLRRQQPRHYPVLVCLSVPIHCLLSRTDQHD